MPRLAEYDCEGPAGMRVPGLYAHLLNRDQREHDMIDPRYILGDELNPAELERLTAEAKAAPPSGRLAALLAGRPVTVPVWVVTGQTFAGAHLARGIPWIADARWPDSFVKVWPDDRIEPGDRFDQLAGRC